MSDTGYTTAWTLILGCALAVELHALRHRPGQRATLSAHVWAVRGRRFGWRWWPVAALLLRAGHHLLLEGDDALADVGDLIPGQRRPFEVVEV